MYIKIENFFKNKKNFNFDFIPSRTNKKLTTTKIHIIFQEKNQKI